MLASALVAFAHFFAFFALTAALVLQLALLSESISVTTARRIQRADRTYAIAAVLVLIFGILRVVYFEKGVDYYLGNTFFLLKIGLFVAVGLLSIYPTIYFQRWNADLNQDIAPEMSVQALQKIRKIMHTELVGILGILLCASLMAKGFGFGG
jgi:putative membrane protein